MTLRAPDRTIAMPPEPADAADSFLTRLHACALVPHRRAVCASVTLNSGPQRTASVTIITRDAARQTGHERSPHHDHRTWQHMDPLLREILTSRVYEVARE